ncbi:metal ABC transporter solute-binding protein, Zn/Mn family [Desulfogranum mediterraneum]|uniref:metal ABC transporter solute-binding protein, Zn/Mn family n=1 Tax=Desulfogranum mediterraneum TaxID=160661 RepID=UPI0004289F21|nr:zinc ABC transporter substrate-binding protein [Desulfogranum mediterraneum]
MQLKLSPIYTLIFLCSLLGQAAAAPLEVFVSIAPQKWLSDQIGQDQVHTHILIANNQEPHSFEPSPRQIAQLSAARLYLTVELEFENQLVKILSQNAQRLTIVDVAKQVRKIPMDQHGQEHQHGHGEGGHSPQLLDPHIWLAPANLKIMARNMAAAFRAADPANQAFYQHNLEELNRTLDRLDRELAHQLKPYQGAPFYVFHPSFGYFARAYGLRQEAVEVEGKAPTPKQLARLIAQARKEQIRVIFVQPQFDPKSGAAIARAIDGRVLPLDPLAEDIPANLRAMAAAVAAALEKAP